jgi:hypothetical protein
MACKQDARFRDAMRPGLPSYSVAYHVSEHSYRPNDLEKQNQKIVGQIQPSGAGQIGNEMVDRGFDGARRV